MACVQNSHLSARRMNNSQYRAHKKRLKAAQDKLLRLDALYSKQCKYYGAASVNAQSVVSIKLKWEQEVRRLQTMQTSSGER